MAERPDAETPGEREPRDLVPADDELTPARPFEPAPSLDVESTLSIAVDLPPAPPREVPEDEAAVAIDDVPVDPGFVASPTEPQCGQIAPCGQRVASRWSLAAASSWKM